MNINQIYILIAIVALAIIIALKVFLLKKKNLAPRIYPFASSASVFLIAGLVFGENRLIGYSLVGVGLILAIIDLVMKLKKKK
jgi:ABC-type Fe3+-siderophore transport system permease subunit